MSSKYQNMVDSTISQGEIGTGLPVTRSIYNQRMKVCESCENLDLETRKCCLCGGCVVDLVALQSAYECPSGKWHAWIARIVYHNPKDEKQLPSFMVMVSNAGGAAAEAVSSLFRKKTVRRNEEDQERIHSICKMCPTKKYRTSDDRCSQCGCKLGWKAWVVSSHCPDGHW